MPTRTKRYPSCLWTVAMPTVVLCATNTVTSPDEVGLTPCPRRVTQLARGGDRTARRCA